MLNKMVDTSIMTLAAYILWSKTPDSIKSKFENHVAVGEEPTDNNVLVFIRKDRNYFPAHMNAAEYYVEVTKTLPDQYNTSRFGMNVELTTAEAKEIDKALRSATQYALEYID